MSSQENETKAPTWKSTIESIVLPKQYENHTKWDEIVKKYKSFRLYALGESPEAFASTLAVEKAFAREVWEDRLSSPRATHILVIDCPNAADVTTDSGKVEALLDNKWIAQTVLIEMVNHEVAKLAAEKSPWDRSSPDGVPPVSHQTEEEHAVFVLNGVYVAPGHRQRGTGAKVLAAAIDEGIRGARSRGLSGIQFQVRVDGDNVAAVKLYERAGFARGETERLVMGEKESNGVKIPPRIARVLVMRLHVFLN
ncbi:Cutinase transcription factor 1 beta [Venturia nashicola]|nr:Cutinase transcription factor 1 beta [Venturia nashicola]